MILSDSSFKIQQVSKRVDIYEP